ncbi:hypothetical protein [Vibrio quintilis]|uniref:Phage replication protein O n=1 Tax=Vibrio quintilis TaxID=1117707 RepID=A0A1M7YP12_9VIBR|nr:hypothetical protein [Vibrio quintilis]SHO54384.1 hypothetical protein VQ7734_00098 [Vibrio quintilis]
MRFSLFINQAKSIEWELNFQQAALFSCLYELQSWGRYELIDGHPYYWAGKNKIIEEIPLVFEKPDTLKRHMIALENKGLIERKQLKNMPFVRITEKGKAWNQHNQPEPEKGQPEKVVKKITTSEESCKKSRPTREKDHDPSREKNHDNKCTSNTNTKDQCIKKNKQKSPLDFSCWPEMPSEEILKDWKLVRDRNRAPITQIVINRMAKKFRDAREQFGLSVDDVLGICIERGWRGFEVQWLVNLRIGHQQAPANRQEAIEMKNQSAIDQWLGDTGNTYDHGEYDQ